MWQSRFEVVERLQTNQLFPLLCTTLSTEHTVHTEEFPAVMLRAGNENVKQLSYTVGCSLFMGWYGQKHVGVGVVEYYSNSFKTIVCICGF